MVRMELQISKKYKRVNPGYAKGFGQAALKIRLLPDTKLRKDISQKVICGDLTGDFTEEM